MELTKLVYTQRITNQYLTNHFVQFLSSSIRIHDFCARTTPNYFSKLKIGLIKEGKTPPDKRVPLSPAQCLELKEKFPHVQIVAQSSDIRAFTDDEYRAAGIEVVRDVSDCDVLLGVKEVPINQLIPNKTYFFFSHTFKKQPYNRSLLKAILEKNIRLVDYEVLRSAKGARLIGFGRYAGIVGAYNAFRGYGLNTGRFELRPAHECKDRAEMELEFTKISLPEDFKIVMTGQGRVAKGAMEVLNSLKIEKVPIRQYLTQTFDKPVFAQLGVLDYNRRLDGGVGTRNDFYSNPESYRSDFMRFAKVSDMYLACHYWGEGSPYIFTREDAKKPEFKISFVSDISADINGPVASTLRPSTIDSPFYGYDPKSESEVNLGTENSIGVQAVDNLPCELPRDASEDFGRELIDKVLPYLIGEDPDAIIARGTETENGQLAQNFIYLKEWVEGEED